MSMAAMNSGNGPLPGMPVMNKGANGATPRPGGDPEDCDIDARLNAYIYDYFIRSSQFDAARTLFHSKVQMKPSLKDSDTVMNGGDEDSKDENLPSRPKDLPAPNVSGSDGQGGPFLLEWFSLFWDVFRAQRDKTGTAHAYNYVQNTQAQSRFRTEQQNQLLRNGIPGMMPADYQMMRMQNGQMNDNLRTKAMVNRGNFQATPQQIQQMKNVQQQQQQHLMQQSMRRDPSDMDINGQRARTPSSGDNAPSPSKRQRIDTVPFNAQQMMQNGRVPMQGMQGQPMMEAMNPNNPASQMLLNAGIDPENLTQAQFASFQQQNPAIQNMSIKVYNQNLQRNGGRPVPKPGMPGQGSPMMQPGFDPGAADYNQAMMRGVAPGNANNGNHALQDYQMQLMLLEQQNKKRLLMARQEQDTIRQPDGQPMPGGPGFAPGMSPSGSRSGPSPGPNEQMGKRTPKMGQAGLPGSPMPDGSMAQARGSPVTMNFSGQMPADMYQMRGMENGMGPVGPNGMRMPPSSHPGQMGPGAMNPAQQQQFEAMRAQQPRMPNGQQWQGQPPPGQAPVMQPSQGQQTAQMGTPQQRNAMPPPQGVPAGTGANGVRPTSPAQGAPPTPQPANKANPKGKKETKEPRKRPNKKNSTASVAATPAGEQEAPPTPTPATPITPQHPNSFAAGQKSEAPNQAAVPPNPAAAAPAPGLALPQADVNMVPQFGLEGAEGQYNMAFGNLEGGDVLDNFDFDSFLHDDGGFDFDATNFNMSGGDGVEAGAEGA